MKDTTFLKKNEPANKWYVVDVEDKVLGRAATKIATLLSGKDRPDYTPHIDSGAGVIVLNCDKARVTGKKFDEKQYKSFSGYPGGQRTTPYKEQLKKDPRKIIHHAVKGMLPKNKLGSRMIRRLKIYKGTEHPHQAQMPEKVEL